MKITMQVRRDAGSRQEIEVTFRRPGTISIGTVGGKIIAYVYDEIDGRLTEDSEPLFCFDGTEPGCDGNAEG